MIVAVDEEVDDAGEEHDVNKRRDQRKKHLEDENVGQREEAHGFVADECGAMLPDGLQGAEGPAEALAHEAFCIDGRLSVGESAVFKINSQALFEQVHGEVGVFGDGVERIAAGRFDGSGAPCADGAGDDGDDVKEVESAALKILAGDVFEGLPAGPEIDAVADLGVAGDGADSGILEMRNEF